MFTDEDRKMLKAVRDGWFVGGDSTKYKQPWQNLIDDIPRRIWDTQITGRPGGPVRAIQELANVRTDTLELKAAVAGLTEAVKQLATGQGLDPALITNTINDAITKGLSEIRLVNVKAEVGE